MSGNRGSAWLLLMLLAAGSVSADNHELQAMRVALAELRGTYEARIAALERRLAAVEAAGTGAADAAAPAAAAWQVAQTEALQQPDAGVDFLQAAPPTSLGAAPQAAAGRAAGNLFNPAIGVIFQGSAWHAGRDPDTYQIPGFPLGGEAGPVTRGLAIGETEVDISANVDDKFTAWLTLPVVFEDGEVAVEIEEAWIETTALPAGLAARMGRFFSGIGYLNGKHSHAWDFIDQPLPYQAFLGDQYLDDGVQLRWLAPTDTYLEFGAEILRGGRYPSGGAARSGFGSHSVFVNLGGDLGDSSWLVGVSHLQGRARGRPSGDPDDALEFVGDTRLTGAHFVWKWSPDGNWKQRNLVVQSELMWRDEDGDYSSAAGLAAPYDAGQRGWYVQAVYQPLPRWRFGGRVDGLSAAGPGAAFAGSALDPEGSHPRRYSLMADWSNSEFSRLRLQYTWDDASRRSGPQVGLQYIHSIGAHGAHTF